MTITIVDRIRARQLTLFDDVQLQLRYDSVASTFRFSFYYTPDSPELKDMACIGHYHIVYIEHENKRLLTGYVLSEEFEDAPDGQTLVTLAGYSLPGVLEDCNIVGSLQANNLALLHIAGKVCEPFPEIVVKFDKSISADMLTPYEQVTATPMQSIRSFLSELASQKNIVVGHDEFGALVFKRAPVAQQSIAFIEKTPTNKFKTSFNGQGMHSQITIVEQADFDELIQSTSFTVKNPLVIKTAYRPRVIVKNAGNTDNDTRLSAMNALAQELRGLSWKITLNTLQLAGKVIEPGKVITAMNPKVYLFRPTDLFVEQVDLHKTTETEEVTLTCVLPSVYNGSIPINPFSGINLH